MHSARQQCGPFVGRVTSVSEHTVFKTRTLRQVSITGHDKRAFTQNFVHNLTLTVDYVFLILIIQQINQLNSQIENQTRKSNSQFLLKLFLNHINRLDAQGTLPTHMSAASAPGP